MIFPEFGLVVSEITILIGILMLYADVIHGGICRMLMNFYEKSKESTRILQNVDAGADRPSSRRRCLEQTCTSNHEYPLILLRRLPDLSLLEEHSTPYKVQTKSGDRALLVRDPHRWLEDDKSLRTLAWIKAQQNFSTAYLKKLIDGESLDSFKDKIRESRSYQEIGMIFQKGAKFFYFSRWLFSEQNNDSIEPVNTANQYSMYETEDLSLEGELLLDPNIMLTDPAVDRTDTVSSLYIRGTWVSNDGILMVYGYTSDSHNPWMTLKVRNITTGIDFPEPDVISGVCHIAATSVEWLDRACGFFYSCYNAPPDKLGILPLGSKHRICFHRLGSHQSDDLVVYEGGADIPDRNLEKSTNGLAESDTVLASVRQCDPPCESEGNLHVIAPPSNRSSSRSPISKEIDVFGKNTPFIIEETSDGDCSDADSGLGSETWTEIVDNGDTDVDGNSIVYIEWAGRKEFYRPRISVDGRYLFIEIFLDGMDSEKGVDNILPGSSRATHANKLFYFDLSSFHGESHEALGQCVKLIDVFDSRWEYVLNIEEESWVRTNFEAPNFRIMRISLPDLEIFESVSKSYLAGVLRSIWMYALEWIPESPNGSLLEKADIAAHTVLVLKYLCDSSYNVLLYDLTQTLDESSQHHIAELPNVRHCHIEGPWCNFQSPNIFYHCSGFAEPGCIFRTIIVRNAYSGSIELHFEPTFTPHVPNLKLSSYETRQDFCKTKIRRVNMLSSFSVRNAPSANTTFLKYQHQAPSVFPEELDLPMYIFASTDAKDKRPCIMFVCGSFGVSVTPAFSLPLIMFVKHYNAIVCIVNVRGGGELGVEWHWDGQGGGKQNAVDDVITAAEYLIENGYTTKERLGLMGGTCAGTIIGACISQRSDLFSAVVIEDGLFDLMRHHIISPPTGEPTFPARYQDNIEDGAIDFKPLWSTEFGSVDNATYEEISRILKFSPLHNIRGPGIIHHEEKSQTSQSTQFFSSAHPPVGTTKLFPAVLLVTSCPEDATIPRSHSFKFVAELQRVCGSSSSNPILIHIMQSDKDKSDECRRLETVTVMIAFMARFIGATFVDADEDSVADLQEGFADLCDSEFGES